MCKLFCIGGLTGVVNNEPGTLDDRSTLEPPVNEVLGHGTPGRSCDGSLGPVR